MCGLASAAAPTGPMFSSKPGPCCWLPTWPPSPLMFRDVRQVGQEVSCSSHDRRHELKKHKTRSSTYCIWMYCSLYWLDFTGLSSISGSGLLLPLRLLIAWCHLTCLAVTDLIKYFVNITACHFWEVQRPFRETNIYLWGFFYLWKRWPQGSLRAVNMESQQMAQSSSLAASSSAVATANLQKSKVAKQDALSKTENVKWKFLMI